MDAEGAFSVAGNLGRYQIAVCAIFFVTNVSMLRFWIFSAFLPYFTDRLTRFTTESFICTVMPVKCQQIFVYKNGYGKIK